MGNDKGASSHDWKQASWQRSSWDQSRSSWDQRSTPAPWQRSSQYAEASTSKSRPPVPPKSVAKEAPLPHPWEEQFSEEHGIPYFWNSETGEAVWERRDIK